MKKMKKLASILLAAIMVLAMAVPAMAGNVKITDSNGIPLGSHTFTAYQIFTGTQTNGDQTLTDIDWGADVNKGEILTAVQAVEGFADCKSARDVAEKLDEVSENKATLEAFIVAVRGALGKGQTVSNETILDAGYYLFVDDTENLDGTDDARNASLLQVTGDGDIEITVKTDKPSVEKKVKENVKEIADDGVHGAQYNDVADYNIGDDVPFQFYSKVPDMTYYENYVFTFHDTMDKGLTFNKDSLEITIGETKLESNEYTLTTEDIGSETFRVSITLKSEAVTKFVQDQDVRITYTAKLNEAAEIGLPGNKNKVYLEYSNNPDGTGTGQTKEDTVIVFTYELDVNKKSGKDSTALQGAEFILTNEDGSKYAKVDNEGKFDGWTDQEGEASTLTSDSNGLFKIIGLDDGTYKLIEKKAPAGYNLLKDPITLIVKATTNNTQTWADADAAEVLTALTIDINGGENESTVDQEGDKESGIVSADVINNSGATLPETGGIGTTIFYVLGSILVLGAVILLVTKKRMSVEK